MRITISRCSVARLGGFSGWFWVALFGGFPRKLKMNLLIMQMHPDNWHDIMFAHPAERRHELPSRPTICSSSCRNTHTSSLELKHLRYNIRMTDCVLIARDGVQTSLSLVCVCVCSVVKQSARWVNTLSKSMTVQFYKTFYCCLFLKVEGEKWRIASDLICWIVTIYQCIYVFYLINI